MKKYMLNKKAIILFDLLLSISISMISIFMVSYTLSMFSKKYIELSKNSSATTSLLYSEEFLASEILKSDLILNINVLNDVEDYYKFNSGYIFVIREDKDLKKDKLSNGYYKYIFYDIKDDMLIRHVSISNKNKLPSIYSFKNGSTLISENIKKLNIEFYKNEIAIELESSLVKDYKYKRIYPYKCKVIF